MAWRDSQKNRGRLLLFISSIVLGIAALVAINSFSQNLQSDIDLQAKELLGADFEVHTNRALSDSIFRQIDSIPGERAREYSFPSMVLFPKGGSSRLVQVRALEGNFPFYGALETAPPSAGMSFRNKRGALVDETLMLQFDAKIGDTVQVGESYFIIEGALLQVPGQTGFSLAVAPSVYIPMQYLQKTGLVQVGSRIRYEYYYKLPEQVDAEKLKEQMQEALKDTDLDFVTVEDRKRSISRTFENLSRFLNLVAFIALLLGCVGVASAVHVYIKEKIETVAIIRCLGASGTMAFLIFLLQIIIMGFMGSVAGAVLGSLMQTVLPQVLQDFVPIEISLSISWSAIFSGVATGVGISVLFALLPLLRIRRISPLHTLRSSVESPKSDRDPWRWLGYLLVALFVAGFAWSQAQNWMEALVFSGSLALVFLLLAGTGMLIMWITRRFFPVGWSYVARQGLANLYRPNNQTLMLTVTIGMGTMLLSTLFFTQNLLLDQVKMSTSGAQPNMVLFDIQPHQAESVKKLVEAYDLPVLQQVPIVTMRLVELKGKDKQEYASDTTSDISSGVFDREYRVTYRDHLTDSEELVAGEWPAEKDAQNRIPISLEEGFAERMHSGIGDELLFNVQGTLMHTYISGLREIEWNRIQTNFVVIFPEGVLEDAPRFEVIMTRTPTDSVAAVFQSAMVNEFPTISVIDITLIKETLDDILGKISFVIRFMAMFSIFTGILVLISSIIISKFQRIRESVLLRTLGASRRQILLINAMEYFLLSSIACITGILLSLLATWALAVFSFEMAFIPDLLPALFIYFIITAITVALGLLNSRNVLNKPPLEVLRTEV